MEQLEQLELVFPNLNFLTALDPIAGLLSFSAAEISSKMRSIVYLRKVAILLSFFGFLFCFLVLTSWGRVLSALH